MVDRNETTGSGGASRETGERSAGDKVKDSARNAQDKASEVTAKAREKGEHLAEEGREKAEELAHRAGDMARSRARDEKVRVADGIRTVADALRRGSEDLPEDRQSYGRFVNAVADRAEGLSRYLEERDVDDMAREARRFARENTGVVLSGAFALGLLGARFLKSSNDEVRSERWISRGYEGEGTYEAGYRTSGGYPQPGGYGQPGAYSRGEIHSGRRDIADIDAMDELEREGPGVGRDPAGLNLDRPDMDTDRTGGL